MHGASWLTSGRILLCHALCFLSLELTVPVGGGRDFVALKAQLLLAQHTLEIDLALKRKDRKPSASVSERGTCLSVKCKFLMPGLQQPLGSPDTEGEGVWEKIKHEDMAVCVLGDINSLLARVMGKLGSYEKMNTVFLVPGCLVHKEPLVRETLGVTSAFHLVGQFPGQLSLGARPAPTPGAAPAAALVMFTASTNECFACSPP